MVEPEPVKLLELAIKNGDAKAAAAIVNDNPSLLTYQTVFGTWLHIAAKRGHLEIMKWVLEHGLDVNTKGGIGNGTPLLAAASNGKVEAVKLLISRGADLDTSKPESNPLFAAIDEGQPEVAQLLIDSGIDTTVKYKGTSGKTKDALSYARDWGREDIAEMILESRKK